MRVGAGVARAFLSGHRLELRVRAKLFSVLASGSFASFGKHSVIEPPVRLHGESHIAVGDGVFVGAGSWLQAIGDAPGVQLALGDGTSIAGNVVLSAAASIRVGRKVLFARGVYVSDHAHRFDDPSRPVLDQGIDRVEPVEIGDGAWLGENVVVCPGVRIGRGAVVGANSVVTEGVPDHAVAVGAPARIVRRLGAPLAAAR